MNGKGKSDDSIVPKKPVNKGPSAGRAKRLSADIPAERVEGRESTKDNSPQQTRFRTQNRADLQQALRRIRVSATRDKQQRFTSLWHHVYNPQRLREEYFLLKRHAAPGVDGATWQEYGRNLEENLQDLSDRLQRGAYHAQPVKRTHIPKSDGRQRPIGIPTLEDKIVQRATVSVLQAVFEADFMGFSYGFRPGRDAHQAIDALAVGIAERKVNWVLDADIRGFFDAIDHEWMMKFVEHRIADRRMSRHVKKWLRAGVMENGRKIETKVGTPQGGSISPLLANIYLHYVFDLWATQWRKRSAVGDVIIVRYADDFVVGFQHKEDAETFLAELRVRLGKFSLELHDEKTRLIEFGRFASQRRSSRREGKPETFDFLGFTHICGKTRKTGKFIVYRRPMAKRLRGKLQELKYTLLRNRHAPVKVQGRWLRAVLNGWYQYYAVPMNLPTLVTLRRQVARLWYRALRRRSHKTRVIWQRMYPLIERWLPQPRILHPYPWERIRVMTRGRSPVR